MAERIINLSKVNLRAQNGKVCFGDIIYAPGGICGPRVQNDYQLVLLFSGSLNLLVNKKKYAVPANSAILLGPQKTEYFQFSTTSTTHHGWCALHPSLSTPPIRQAVRNGPVIRPISSRIKVLYDYACNGVTHFSGEDSAAKNSWAQLIAAALITEFLIDNTLDIIKKGASTPLNKAEQIIYQNYSSPITLASLAKEAGVSRQHLLKLFRLHRNETPTEMLYSRRMEVASDMLKMTGLTIQQISDQCGFSNAFHFSRKFRHKYNMTPSQFRKESW